MCMYFLLLLQFHFAAEKSGKRLDRTQYELGSINVDGSSNSRFIATLRESCHLLERSKNTKAKKRKTTTVLIPDVQIDREDMEEDVVNTSLKDLTYKLLGEALVK